MTTVVNRPGNKVIDYGDHAIQYIWYPSPDGRDLWKVIDGIRGDIYSMEIGYVGSPNNKTVAENMNRYPPYCPY